MAKKTLVGLLFDQTGSMISCKIESLDGVGEYIKTLQQDGKNIRFTQIWFNSDNPFQIVHDNVKMSEVVPPTASEYQPASNTPLYDALGNTIHHMDKRLKAATGKSKVLIVVMTDGLENASQEYDQKRIFDLVEKKKKKGWAFAFLGADIDSFAVGGQLGVASASTLNYDKTKSNRVMHRVALATTAYAGNPNASGDTIFEDVEDDDATWRTK